MEENIDRKEYEMIKKLNEKLKNFKADEKNVKEKDDKER